ncbi:hypothetical protein EIP91_008400 [Steccherinum ochraceum]|uniref:Uncharacterized protein n=1 Tax=Steccherinum ochraceum TaxID=92696 RepID=A0A4R0R8L1_9APHY|nr:hypothetical protein EIP91_008400 [Steccherinum ochraceum]
MSLGSYNQAAWDTLASKEAILYQKVLELRSQMNALVPVCSFPAEILQHIFLWIRDDSQPESVLRISQVCVAWRTAAIAYRDLWTSIDARNQAFTSMFCQRSVTMPLCLHRKAIDGENVKWELEAIRKWSSHFSHIDVELGQHDMEKMCQYLNTLPWHGLSSLSLNLPPEWSPDNFNVTIDFSFNNHPPLDLRHISLSKVGPAAWVAMNAYRNLRTLSLNHLYDGPAFNPEPDPVPLPDMIEFLNTLENLPWLEKLQLIYAGPELLDRGSTMYPKLNRSVRLVYLRELCITTMAIDVAYLLAHLSLPASTHMFVQARMRDRPFSLHSFLPNAQSSTLPPLRKMFRIQVGLVVEHILRPGVLAYRREGHELHEGGHCVSLSESFDSRVYPAAGRSLLLEVGDVFCHSRLVEMKVLQGSHLWHEFTVDDWCAALSRLPHVADLEVECVDRSTVETYEYSIYDNDLETRQQDNAECILILLEALSRDLATSSMLLPALATFRLTGFHPDALEARAAASDVYDHPVDLVSRKVVVGPNPNPPYIYLAEPPSSPSSQPPPPPPLPPPARPPLSLPISVVLSLGPRDSQYADRASSKSLSGNVTGVGGFVQTTPLLAAPLGDGAHSPRGDGAHSPLNIYLAVCRGRSIT